MSAANLGRILEPIVTRSLYCASPEELNDALEGRRAPVTGLVYPYREHWQELAAGLRVCSFSKEFDNHLLWAYYANGFRGVALEFELQDEPGGPSRLRVVKYVENALEQRVSSDPLTAAYDSLTCKSSNWSHENEVRIITPAANLREGKYYGDAILKRVIIGFRLEGIEYDTLTLICRQFGVPYETAKTSFRQRKLVGLGGIYLSDR
jgi:hypothetical protein